MTKQQASKYAAQCYKAQAQARKNGTTYIKPERPDANQLEAMETVARTSKKKQVMREIEDSLTLFAV